MCVRGGRDYPELRAAGLNIYMKNSEVLETHGAMWFSSTVRELTVAMQ